jgi:hypothetical protein
MNIEEYISTRVDEQINWYDKNSTKCQSRYKRLQVIEIVLAATIPLLSGYAFRYFWVPIIIGVLGVIITIIESITKLSKYHENWIAYRSTCELLKYQKYLFITKSYPYNTEPESMENFFIKNIEQIISSENNQWKTMHVKNIDQEKKKID